MPQHQVEIDRAIAASLSEKWKLERVDSILRAILRCGVFELVARRDVPAKVVIDEYVAVAGAFFGGDEPGFVNAALDTSLAASARRSSACRCRKANWISESEHFARNLCRIVALRQVAKARRRLLLPA